MALACLPLAAALLTEGRSIDAGLRLLVLVGLGVALAAGAFLVLRRRDAAGGRGADARERVLRQAREQQAATAEILGAMAASPPDLQRVLDTIARNAARVCDGFLSAVARFDGQLIHLVAHHHVSPEALEVLRRQFPCPADDSSNAGRVIRTGKIVHVVDATADASTPELARETARAQGFKSVVVVPLLHEGRALGALSVARLEGGGFSERQIQLLRAFAAQAVIAIENVRLFQEVEARNRELTESLQQQTATAEVLAVISRSPTDLQPVLEAVARNASRLCGAANVSLYRVEGDLMRKVAEQGLPVAALGVGETRAISRTTVSGRAIVDRMTRMCACSRSSRRGTGS